MIIFLRPANSHVFLSPGFSGPVFLWVQIFQDPGFSGSRFVKGQVQGQGLDCCSFVVREVIKKMNLVTCFDFP